MSNLDTCLDRRIQDAECKLINEKRLKTIVETYAKPFIERIKQQSIINRYDLTTAVGDYHVKYSFNIKPLSTFGGSGSTRAVGFGSGGRGRTISIKLCGVSNKVTIDGISHLGQTQFDLSEQALRTRCYNNLVRQLKTYASAP